MGRSPPTAVTRPPADIADVRVLWVLPQPDPAALRAVVADVRARLAARASRATR